MPTVSIAAFNLALQHFSTEVAPEPLYLLMDRAEWHVSDKVQVPSHMRLLFQPAYSPEFQPAEHLWTLLNEPLVNRHFSSLDNLETTVIAQCQRLRTQQERVRAATLFHWWSRMGQCYIFLRILYYNTARPHQGIAQQIPVPLSNKPNTSGRICCRDVLDGIIHDYYRDAA